MKRNFDLRRHLLLLLVLCCPAMPIWAERIDVATAQKVAQNVALQGGQFGLRSDVQVSLVYTAEAKGGGAALRSDGTADYFVFNFSNNGGFAIISGEDRVRPVLGYSHKGSFDPDNLPPNLRGMLASYQEQIAMAVNQGIEATEDVAGEWSSVLSGAMPKTRATTMATAKWNQGDPYNRMTPKIGDDATMTGCVATAMGIVMKYHEYPAKAVNPPAKNTYKVNDNEVSATITYGTYDWDNMLDSYVTGSYTDTQADAVATLLFHCGANVYMNYGKDGSGTSTKLIASALRDVFGYSPEIRFLSREAYRWKEWKAMLREELDNGYPVIYDGYDSSEDGGGHAFVCDGYDDNDYYSINWGWGGYADGYFALNLLMGFKDDQNMITHIRPEATGETYYVRPYLSSAEYTRSNDTVWVSFDMKYCALDDKAFWFGLGVADKDNAIVQAPKEDESFSGKLNAFLEGWSEYEFDSLYTTHASTTLADDQRVTMLCSLDGTTWEVMRTMDDVPTGISKEEIEEDDDSGDNDDDEDELFKNQIIRTNYEFTKAELEEILSNVDEDIIRIKGYVNSKEGTLYLNYVLNEYNIYLGEKREDTLVSIIGTNIDRNKYKEVFHG